MEQVAAWARAALGDPVIWIVALSSLGAGVLLRPPWSIGTACLALIGVYLLMLTRDQWSLFYALPFAILSAAISFLIFWVGYFCRRTYEKSR